MYKLDECVSYSETDAGKFLGEDREKLLSPQQEAAALSLFSVRFLSLTRGRFYPQRPSIWTSLGHTRCMLPSPRYV